MDVINLNCAHPKACNIELASRTEVVEVRVEEISVVLRSGDEIRNEAETREANANIDVEGDKRLTKTKKIIS